MRRLKLRRFDRFMILLLVLLVAGLAIAAWVSNVMGLQPPALAADQVGVHGPIGITFSQKMQTQTVESRFTSDPKLAGRTSWDGQTLWFWPSQNLEVGKSYTFRLDAGATAEDGQVVRKAQTWTVQMRPVRIAYLSPAREGSEVWVANQDGSQAIQLTHTGNKVYDFAVSFNGEWIAYSVENKQSGTDLWTMAADGSQEKQVIACGADSCTEPAWSTDGKTIAYSRRRLSVVQGETYSPLPRIWTYDLATGQTAPLFQDATIGGEGPSWSPDGQRLAFFDAPHKVIHVLDIQTGKELMLQSQLGVVGAWTSDGTRLFYGDLVSTDTAPFGSGFVADMTTDKIDTLFSKIQNQEDFGLPVPSPDGKWVVVGIRYHGGSHSTQLEMMRPDGTEMQTITDNFLFTNGAYSWDPSGQKVLYQRVQIGTSQAVPAIWAWDRSTGKAVKLVENAILPVWLP